MSKSAFTIRSATEKDQRGITALVHGERLNPDDLDWRRFVVAADRTGLLGAVQMRVHPDRSRELGSLVVRKDARGRGIAEQLIDALLESVGTRVLMITGARFASHYRRWGFRRIRTSAAPRAVRRNFYLGTLVGGFLAFLAGRKANRLAILLRPPAGARHE